MKMKIGVKSGLLAGLFLLFLLSGNIANSQEEEGQFLSNPSFEQGLANWNSHQSDKIVEIGIDDKIVHTGKKSAFIRKTEGTPSEIVSLYSFSIKVEPGETYTLSGHIKTELEKGKAYVSGVFLDQGENYISGSLRESAVKLDGINDWTRQEFTMTAPSETTFLRFYFQTIGFLGTFWCDDAEVRKGVIVGGKEIEPPTGNPLKFAVLGHPSLYQAETQTDAEGRGSRERWGAVIKELNKSNDISFLFNTGDTAFPENWTTLFQLTKPLKIPWYLANGLHDIEKMFGEKVVEDMGLPAFGSFTYRGIHFIYLPQDDTSGLPLEGIAPNISEEQMRWFREDLEEHQDETIIIFTHMRPSFEYSKEAYGFGTQKHREINSLVTSVTDSHRYDISLWFHSHTTGHEGGSVLFKGLRVADAPFFAVFDPSAKPFLPCSIPEIYKDRIIYKVYCFNRQDFVKEVEATDYKRTSLKAEPEEYPKVNTLYKGIAYDGEMYNLKDKYRQGPYQDYKLILQGMSCENLLNNSSFEEDIVTMGLPPGWGFRVHGEVPEAKVNGWKIEAQSGTALMWLQKAEEPPSPDGKQIFYIRKYREDGYAGMSSDGYEIVPKKTYCFSLYYRTDRDYTYADSGVFLPYAPESAWEYPAFVRLGMSYYSDKELNSLVKDYSEKVGDFPGSGYWRRIYFSSTAPEDAKYIRVSARILLPGYLLLDAAQVQEGNFPTDYLSDTLRKDTENIIIKIGDKTYSHERSLTDDMRIEFPLPNLRGDEDISFKISGSKTVRWKIVAKDYGIYLARLKADFKVIKEEPLTIEAGITSDPSIHSDHGILDYFLSQYHLKEVNGFSEYKNSGGLVILPDNVIGKTLTFMFEK